jgi:hypothetical protein
MLANIVEEGGKAVEDVGQVANTIIEECQASFPQRS